MINQDAIDKAGGDWGQTGELQGDALVEFLRSNVGIVWADKGVLIAVRRPDGAVGTYQLAHVPDFQ